MTKLKDMKFMNERLFDAFIALKKVYYLKRELDFEKYDSEKIPFKHVASDFNKLYHRITNIMEKFEKKYKKHSDLLTSYEKYRELRSLAEQRANIIYSFLGRYNFKYPY